MLSVSSVLLLSNSPVSFLWEITRFNNNCSLSLACCHRRPVSMWWSIVVHAKHLNVIQGLEDLQELFSPRGRATTWRNNETCEVSSFVPLGHELGLQLKPSVGNSISCQAYRGSRHRLRGARSCWIRTISFLSLVPRCSSDSSSENLMARAAWIDSTSPIASMHRAMANHPSSLRCTCLIAKVIGQCCTHRCCISSADIPNTSILTVLPQMFSLG